MIKTLQEFKKAWKNTPDGHKLIHETFVSNVNSHAGLKAHRDFVDNNIFGFGERSFQWLWKLLVDEMPDKFQFLEIGVFKGQILTLIEMLAKWTHREAYRIGVTPLSSAGLGWESDYKRDIEFFHDQFELRKDYFIMKGDSTDPDIITAAKNLELDILYIDGGHTKQIAASDIKYFAPLVKPGGYLVIDDCCNDFTMPFGYFTGIKEVTQAVNESQFIKDQFEFVGSVVHIKVWKRK